jgi:hypothetical protein
MRTVSYISYFNGIRKNIFFCKEVTAQTILIVDCYLHWLHFAVTVDQVDSHFWIFTVGLLLNTSIMFHAPMGRFQLELIYYNK